MSARAGIIVLRVRGFAATTLDSATEAAEMAEESGEEEADILAAVARAYRDGALRFTREEADAVASGLCDMANSEDGFVEEHKSDPDAVESVRMARAARDGLSSLSVAARRAAAKVTA